MQRNLYLGIDPGLKITALAVVDSRGNYVSYSLISTGKTMTLGYLYHAVREQVIGFAEKVALAAVERQYQGSNRTFRSVEAVIGAAAVIEAAVENLNIDVANVHPSQWQRYLKLGRNKKRAAVKAASKRLAAALSGLELPPDASDALFIALAGMRGAKRRRGRKSGRYAGW